jgi:hypothetical protein
MGSLLLCWLLAWNSTPVSTQGMRVRPQTVQIMLMVKAHAKQSSRPVARWSRFTRRSLHTSQEPRIPQQVPRAVLARLALHLRPFALRL